MNIESLSDISVKQTVLAQILGMSGSAISKKAQQLQLSLNSSELNNTKKGYSLKNLRVLGEHFFSNNYKIEKKVHVFYNFKGGTGKTTLTYQISHVLFLMGFKVLVIDLDSQAHLSTLLRCEEEVLYSTIYDVLINGRDIKQVVKEAYDGFNFIPSNLRLTKIEVPLSQKTRREEILSKHIKAIKDEYDFVLIDTNPTISTLNINALFAADHINIVCETQPLSLSGLGILVEELGEIFKDIGRKFDYSVIPNKYESRTVTAQEVLGALRADYGEHVISTVIRKCEDFNLSTKLRKPVFSFANKQSPAFEDLIDCCHEIIKISSLPLTDMKKRKAI
jgi:chromosome partitioning protein